MFRTTEQIEIIYSDDLDKLKQSYNEFADQLHRTYSYVIIFDVQYYAVGNPDNALHVLMIRYIFELSRADGDL